MKRLDLDPDDLNLITLAQEYSDNDKARALVESLRWPNGPVCPHCKNHDDKPIYTIKPAEHSKTRKGVYKCGACRNQFTVTVGSIFEDSHIPLGKWLMAIFILCSSKKAISAHQLHRMLGVTYKTAWFLAHRIRFCMGPELPLTGKLSGTVEVDETYVGGVGDRKTKILRKTPVIALVERGGNMRAAVVSNVTQKTLRKAITECVDKGAVLNTDDSLVYRKQFKDYARHDVVKHRRLEYTRKNPDGSVSGINHCESFFSLLKRGVFGAWHHVSREHLPKYANEFAFRWNTRHDTDGKRMTKAIARMEGKRLTYKQAV
jgi:transposase-like protein